MFGTKSIDATIAHTPPIIVVDTSTTSTTKKKMRMAPIVTKHAKNNRPRGLTNFDTPRPPAPELRTLRSTLDAEHLLGILGEEEPSGFV